MICRTICEVKSRVLHHEIEGPERLVRLVNPMNEVDHLQREVHEKRVEQVSCDGVNADEVEWSPPHPRGDDVQEQHERNAGHDG